MKNQTGQIILFVFLAIAVSCNNQNKPETHTEGVPQNKTYTEFLETIDAKIPEWMENISVPGVAFALIEDGAVVFKKGYGYANVANLTSITPETGFNIGSISKTLTAWGVLKLVEQGKVRLDDPVENYLTRWHLPPSEFSNDEVTIRRLLSNTAGLSVHGFPGYTKKADLPTLEQVLLGKSNTNERVQIILKPGKEDKYSGGGTTVIQLMIEEVTGLKFEDYMKKEILDPLGMEGTTFTIDDAVLSSSSRAHDESGIEVPLVLFTAKAAAGAHTNLNDLCLFALASLDAEKVPNHNKSYIRQTILKPEYVDLMTRLAPNSKMYGLGYEIDLIKDNLIKLVGKEGNNYGWNAYFKVDRASGDGFVMMTNGGSHRNVYKQLECEWLSWKLSKSTEYRCESRLLEELKMVYQNKGVKTMLDTYKSQKEKNKFHFIYGAEDFFSQLGDYLVEQNQLNDAIEVFNFNYLEYPDSFDAYYTLGSALIEASMLDRYLHLTEKRLKTLEEREDLTDSEKAGEMIYIGIQLKDMGDYEKAKNVLKQTLSIRQRTSPKNWTTFNTESILGEVHMHLTEYELAYKETSNAYFKLKKNVQTIPNAARKLRMQQALNRVLKANEKIENSNELHKWEVEQSFVDSL
ncbi:MAG: serine hydrolase [Bacteroidota bacterium]